MSRPLKIAFFGSSLVSAYWNGAATYYRGIIKALHALGHQVTFYEPDAYQRQENRDIADPDWAQVVVYAGSGEAGVRAAVAAAGGADVIVKASGVGVFDDLLEGEVLRARGSGALAVYWDVDAPATLERVRQDAGDPFLPRIPQYDFIFTYGGGPPVIDAYRELGARECVPIYNGLDPDTHHPVPPSDKFACDLAFLGNRLPDREARVEQFFLNPAAETPARRFLMGGSGWADKPVSANVEYVGHVYTADHNAFNCTPVAVLNISRESMATYGYSPATRVFEAAGAGACIITDYWQGIEEFFEPGSEILVARNGDEVARIVQTLTPEEAGAIGQAALKRALRDHTYSERVKLVDLLLSQALVNKS